MILNALHKGKWNCTVQALYNFPSYTRLSVSFHAFVSSINSRPIPKYLLEATSNSSCGATMQKRVDNFTAPLNLGRGASSDWKKDS